MVCRVAEPEIDGDRFRFAVEVLCNARVVPHWDRIEIVTASAALDNPRELAALLATFPASKIDARGEDGYLRLYEAWKAAKAKE